MEKPTKADKSVTEFIPSGKQQALLEVMLDPFHRMASVSKQCEIAGVSRDSYYSWMKDPEFAAYYRNLARMLVLGKNGQLLNIGIREATRGGQAGFGYWKELMKMGGMIEDETQVNISGDIVVRFADPNEVD